MTDTWENAVRWYRQTADPSDIRSNYMDLPHATAVHRFRNSPEFRRTVSLIGAPPGTMVEIGAGWGISAAAFALTGWTVSAVEPDPSPLVGVGALENLARELSLPITAHQGTGEDIPLADGTADVIYGRQVLHHVTDLDQTMREVERVLRPGGRAVFVREHVAESDAELDEFLTGHPLHARYGGENALPRGTYLGAGERAGLTLTRLLLPLESIINTFPLRGTQRIKSSLVLSMRRSRERSLSWRERFLGETGAGGRLYSFVWSKPTSGGAPDQATS